MRGLGGGECVCVWGSSDDDEVEEEDIDATVSVLRKSNESR